MSPSSAQQWFDYLLGEPPTNKDKEQDSKHPFVAQIKRRFPELWKVICASSDNILCIPSSTSMSIDSISKDFVTSHILTPGRVPGEFVTLDGKGLHISGSHLVCDMGFRESRKVKVMSVDQCPDGWGGLVTLYNISRPFVGGLLAPEDSREFSSQLMFKYVATIRTFSGAESTFVALDEFSKGIKDHLIHRPSTFDYNITTLAALLKGEWQKAVDRIGRLSSLINSLGGGNSDAARAQVSQILESYLLSSLTQAFYPWLTEQFSPQSDRMVAALQSCQWLTQADVGIRPQFQAPHSEAVKLLCTLSDANTPVDKLLVLKSVVGLIRDAVETCVKENYPDEMQDLEFATDDLVLVVIWVMIRTFPHYPHVYADLEYCTAFHFTSASNSQLWFDFCHFEVAKEWLLSRVPHLTGGCATSDATIERSTETLEIQIPSTHQTENELQTPIVLLQIHRNYHWHLNKIQESLEEEVPEYCPPPTTSPSIYQWNLSPHQPSKLQNLQLRSAEDDSTHAAVVQLDGCVDYYAALSAEGNVYTWGRPSCGRLGRGIGVEIDAAHSTRRPLIVPPAWGSGVRLSQISCGREHMLAVTDHGTLYAWGDNRTGQLGLGSTIFTKASDSQGSRSLKQSQKGAAVYSPCDLALARQLSTISAADPNQVLALHSVFVVSVACGYYHSLCLSKDGKVYSWGRATRGRLGQFLDKVNLPDNQIGAPALVRSFWRPCSPITMDELLGDVSGLRFASVPDDCLRNGSPSTPYTRSTSDDLGTARIIAVSGSKSVVALATTQSSSSLTSLGSVTSNPSSSSSKVVHISAGRNHSIAVTSCGAVYTWGSGRNGCLGHGSHCDEYLPKQVLSLRVPGLHIVAAAACDHTIFLSNTGYLFGCGLNDQYQLGNVLFEGKCLEAQLSDCDDSVRPLLAPCPVDLGDSSEGCTASAVSSISASDCGSTALLRNGKVLFWGNGTSNVQIHIQQANTLSSTVRCVGSCFFTADSTAK